MQALWESLDRPQEVAALVRYKLHPPAPGPTQAMTSSPKVDMGKAEASGASADASHEESEAQRAKCYHFLNATSRSFARVIAELHPRLSYAVCLFYLVLRALDTVEDDMTIPLARKQSVLRNFHTKLIQRGWKFLENAEHEKDRMVLVEFPVIIDQFLTLEPSYQEIIKDITRLMGEGMAEYVGGKRVVSVADYDEYCHYVAGLVGLGLTRLFIASGLEQSGLATRALGDDPRNSLANTMGLFLQKVNIMKDFLGDLEEGRLFWPADVWSRYTPPTDPGVASLAKPTNLPRALACLNHLILLSLQHVPDALEYMSLVQDRTVFQFCAIPQLMAMATVHHFFNNPRLFQAKGNKIRRGMAVWLMEQSTDMERVKQVYLELALDIARKNSARLGAAGSYEDGKPEGGSFCAIGAACADIVRWIHAHDHKVSRPGGVRKPRAKWSRADGTLKVVPKMLVFMTCCAMLTLAVSWLLAPRMPWLHSLTLPLRMDSLVVVGIVVLAGLLTLGLASNSWLTRVLPASWTRKGADKSLHFWVFAAWTGCLYVGMSAATARWRGWTHATWRYARLDGTQAPHPPDHPCLRVTPAWALQAIDWLALPMSTSHVGPGLGRLAVLATLAIASSVASECLQALSPYRSFDAEDILANLHGCAWTLGVVAFVEVGVAWRASRQPSPPLGDAPLVRPSTGDMYGSGRQQGGMVTLPLQQVVVAP